MSGCLVYQTMKKRFRHYTLYCYNYRRLFTREHTEFPYYWYTNVRDICDKEYTFIYSLYVHLCAHHLPNAHYQITHRVSLMSIQSARLAHMYVYYSIMYVGLWDKPDINIYFGCYFEVSSVFCLWSTRMSRKSAPLLPNHWRRRRWTRFDTSNTPSRTSSRNAHATLTSNLHT